MKSENKNLLKINEVLKHEYNTEEKPLTSFPDKLIKHLVKSELSGKVLDVMCGHRELHRLLKITLMHTV